MPELPEVESCRYYFEKLCLHAEIVGVTVMEQGGHARDSLFDDIVYEKIDGKVNPQAYINSLLHRKVGGVYRKGKLMWISFDNNTRETNNMSQMFDACLLHFGMTGSLVIKDHFTPSYKSFEIDSKWPPRFTKLELILRHESSCEDIRVCFTDPRRLGSIRLRNDPWNVPPVSTLAWDITVNDNPSIESVYERLHTRSRAIKTILLDQESVFCGIGNWIADEVLYQSSIHPEKKGSDLSLDQVAILIDKLRYVFTIAIEKLHNKQNFPEEWLFHYRWEKKKGSSIDYHGRKIQFIDVGGRTTAIVPSVLTRQTNIESKTKLSVEESNKADHETNSNPSKIPKRKKLLSEDLPSESKTKMRRTSSK